MDLPPVLTKRIRKYILLVVLTNRIYGPCTKVIEAAHKAGDSIFEIYS